MTRRITLTKKSILIYTVAILMLVNIVLSQHDIAFAQQKEDKDKSVSSCPYLREKGDSCVNTEKKSCCTKDKRCKQKDCANSKEKKSSSENDGSAKPNVLCPSTKNEPVNKKMTASCAPECKCCPACTCKGESKGTLNECKCGSSCTCCDKCCQRA